MYKYFCLFAPILFLSFLGTAQIPDTFGNVTAAEQRNHL